MTDANQQQKAEPKANDCNGPVGGVGHDDADTAGRLRSAGDDLIAGLGVIARAARRAAESVDRSSVDELGKRAARHLNPERLQRIAENGGNYLGRRVGTIPRRLDGFLAGSRQAGPNHSSEDQDNRVQQPAANPAETCPAEHNTRP